MSDEGKHFAASRGDTEFMQRLQNRLEQDAPLLDRMSAPRTEPCPARVLAVLGMVGEPAMVRCSDVVGHIGSHYMLITWTD